MNATSLFTVRPRRLILTTVICLVFVAAGAASGKGPRMGSFSGKLTDSDTGEFIIRYTAKTPAKVSPRKPLGLILGLHGKGGNESQMPGPIGQALATLKLTQEYMVICMKSKGEGWAPEDNEPIRKMIEWALDEYPIDRRRIYGWGYSSGGFGWGRFGPQNQDLMAGVVILGGGVGNLPAVDDPTEKGVQFYLIHGDADDTVKVATARKSREKLESRSYRFVYREITGEGHALVSSSKSWPARRDAMSWCHAIRNRQVALSDSDQKLIDGIMEKLEAKKSLSPKVFNALSRIGGPPAADAIVLACTSKSSGARAAAALVCQKTTFGASVVESLTALLDDRDKKVRLAAFKALGKAAHWQVPEAQKVLCDHAKDVERQLTGRLLAIGELGGLVPMQLSCTHRDRLVFESLIDLLMDSDVKVRTIAFNALMGQGGTASRRTRGRSITPGAPDGFGYNPRAKEARRAQAAGRWREWLK